LPLPRRSGSVSRPMCPVEKDGITSPSREPKMNRGGFSWRRLVGISAMKARVSRTIGIPLTKSGRERKLGHLIIGGGCLFNLFKLLILVLLVLLVRHLIVR
jgi:hypothetical protein